MSNTIGSMVRDLRKARGVTLRQLAEEVGVNFASLSNIENGRSTGSADTLEKIAEALNADVDILLGKAGHKTMPFRVLGSIAAGVPIDAIEHEETFDLANVFNPEDHYLLQVRGDSMVNRGIHDGDLAVMKATNEAVNGDIVAAIVGDEETTLKTFSKEGRKVTLSPANDSLEPVTYAISNIEVRGVLVGVVRTAIG